MSYFGTSSLEYVNQEIESALAFYSGFIDTLQGITGDGVYAYNLPLNKGKDVLGATVPHTFSTSPRVRYSNIRYEDINFSGVEQRFIKDSINRIHHVDYNIETFKGNILNSSLEPTLNQFGQPIRSVEYENIPSTLTEGSPLLDIQKAFTFIERCDIERRARADDYLVKYYVTGKRIQGGELPSLLGFRRDVVIGDIANGFGQITNLFEKGEYEKHYDTQRVYAPIYPSSPSVVSYTDPYTANLETGSRTVYQGLIAGTGVSSEVGTTHFLAENHADNDVFFFGTNPIGASFAKPTGSRGSWECYRGALRPYRPYNYKADKPISGFKDYDFSSDTSGYLYYPAAIINALREREFRIQELKCAIESNKSEEALALSHTIEFINFHSGIVEEWNELAEETFDETTTKVAPCTYIGMHSGWLHDRVHGVVDPTTQQCRHELVYGAGNPPFNCSFPAPTPDPTEYTVKTKTRALRNSSWPATHLFGVDFKPHGIKHYIATYKKFNILFTNIGGSHKRSDDKVCQKYSKGVPDGCEPCPFHTLTIYGRETNHERPYLTGRFSSLISPSESFVIELQRLLGLIPKHFKDLRKKWESELVILEGQTVDASILKGPNGDADTSLKVGFLRSFTTSVKPRSTETFESHINDDIARIARTGYREKTALYGVDLSVNSFGIPVFTGYRLEDPLSEYSYSIFGYRKAYKTYYDTVHNVRQGSDYVIDVLFHDDYDGTKGGQLFTSVNGASSKYAKTTALCRGLEAIRLPVEDTDLYYYNGVNPNSGVSPIFSPNNFMGIGAYETNQAKGYRTSHFYQDNFNEHSFKYELNSFSYQKNDQRKAFDYVKKIIPNPFNVYPSKVNGEFPLVPVDSGFSKTGASTGSGYYFVEEPRTPLISAEAASYSQPKHKYFYYQNYGPSGKGSGSGFHFTKLYQTGVSEVTFIGSNGHYVTELRERELLINPYPRVNTNSNFEIYFFSNDYENWHSSESLYADHYHDYEKEKLALLSTLSGTLSSTIPLRAFGSVYSFLNRTVLTPEIDHSSSYLNGYVNYSPSSYLARYAFRGPNDSENAWNLHKHYSNVNSFGSKSFYTENQQTKDHSGTAFYNIFPNLYNKQVSAHVPVYKDSSSDEPVGENPLTVSSLTKTCLTWIDLASTLESEVHYLNTDCKLWHPYAMDMYVHVNRTNSFTGQLTVAQGQDLYTVDLPGYPKFNVEIYTGESSAGSSNNGINAKEAVLNTFEDFYSPLYVPDTDWFIYGTDARLNYSRVGPFGGSASLNSGSSIINKSATRSVMLESVPSVRSDSAESLYGGATYNSKDDYIILSPVNTENFPRRVNNEVLSEERSLINDQKVKISYQAFHSNPISVKVKLKWGYEMHEQASGDRPINPISGGEEDISAKLSAAGYDLSLERFQDYKIVNLNMPKLFGNPISVFHTNSNSGSFGNYRRNFSPDVSDSRHFNGVAASDNHLAYQYEGFGYAGRQEIDGIFYQRKRYQINPHYRLEFENFEPHFDSNNFGKKSFGDPDASDYHENLKTGCTISIERKYPPMNRAIFRSPFLFDSYGDPVEYGVFGNMYYPVAEARVPVWSPLQPNYQTQASTYKKSHLALSQYWKGLNGVNSTYDAYNNYIFEPREVVLSSPFDYGNEYLSLAGGVSLF